MRSPIDADDAYADRVSISESNVFCNLPCLWRRRSISRSRPVSHVPWLTRPPTLTSSALWLCPSESRPICCSSNSDVEGCVGNSCIPVCRPIAPDRHREFVLPRLAVENRQAVLRRSAIDSADADSEGLERVWPSHRPSATGSTSARETEQNPAAQDGASPRIRVGGRAMRGVRSGRPPVTMYLVSAGAAANGSAPQPDGNALLPELISGELRVHAAE